VIGESSIIGNNVKMYHGVTLGALTVDKNQAQTKRHPTIEDDVVIYSHAVILGGNTVIGKKCTIGGNTWITRSIPPNTVVYNKTEVRVRTNESENEIQ
jgi:serine O-acetyltransferase